MVVSKLFWFWGSSALRVEGVSCSRAAGLFGPEIDALFSCVANTSPLYCRCVAGFHEFHGYLAFGMTELRD